jgi:hypothetical protein
MQPYGDQIPVPQSPLAKNVYWESVVGPAIPSGGQDGTTRTGRASKGWSVFAETILEPGELNQVIYASRFSANSHLNPYLPLRHSVSPDHQAKVSRQLQYLGMTSPPSQGTSSYSDFGWGPPVCGVALTRPLPRRRQGPSTGECRAQPRRIKMAW